MAVFLHLPNKNPIQIRNTSTFILDMLGHPTLSLNLIYARELRFMVLSLYALLDLKKEDVVVRELSNLNLSRA